METLRYVVLANALLGVVSVAYYVLLRRETFFGLNRLMLWLSLAATLLVPLLELPDWRPQPVRTVMQRTARAIVPSVLPKLLPSQPEVTITFPNQQTYRAFQQPVFHWSWALTLLSLYGSGVLWLLIRFITQLRSLQRLIRQSVHELYDDFTLVTDPAITSPFSFFGWVFMNPEQHTASELEQILRHERVHVQERHSLDMIGAELVCIIFWFNPAAYLFRHLVRQALEFSADQTVITEGVDPKSYQYNLLKVSLAVSQSGVTNQFGGQSLRQRIQMMNRRRSGASSGWRYLVWALMISAMALACRHSPSSGEETARFLPTNGIRAAAPDSPNQPWYQQSALLSAKKINSGTHSELLKLSAFNYPLILCLRNNHLALKLPDAFERHVKLFINGQEEPTQQLTTLAFNDVEELSIYQKIDDMPGADRYPESYQILINTTHETVPLNAVRKNWEQFLRINAVSDYAFGVSSTFSMNELLEASFFGNKLAFVKCTDTNYLQLYDDYKDDIDLFIDGAPVKANDIEAVHVREVDKLYTRERPFNEWINDPGRPDRKRRYVLYIQTSPKRAKRDSNYYVFSPFYTGDF